MKRAAASRDEVKETSGRDSRATASSDGTAASHVHFGQENVVMETTFRRSISKSGGWMVLALALSAGTANAQVVFPLPGSPYSAGVMAPSGSTLAVIGGVQGTGADMQSASADALNRMEARLAEVGLDRNSVLRVRAGLAPGDGSEFDGWNAAWSRFFSGGHLPARTTVGSSGLPGNARIILDVVAVFPPDRGYPARVDGARQTLNPQIRSIGPVDNPTTIVSTQAGLFLSSGILPNRGGLSDPESMEQHMRGAMNALTGVLAQHGLQWYDVFFVRSLPTPQPNRSTVDFDGWRPVLADLKALAGGHAPAWTEWSAPGFGTGANGRYVEIEVWAVPQAPHPAFQVIDLGMQNPLLRMTGEGGAIAGGALIAPNAELVFVSGVVAPAGTAPGDEGEAAMNLLAERLSAMGATMADVAELRVYRVQGEAGFNAAYSARFNNAESPHRPVRTNYVVGSLPGGRTVEVEALVVRQPKRF
jgi:2-iminobutanoate/2-iminopropanoate deaminase